MEGSKQAERHVWLLNISTGRTERQADERAEVPTARLCYGGKNVSLAISFFAEKEGVCPRKRLECGSISLSSCKTDFNCEEHFKCCHFACGRRCMDPYEGTGIQVEAQAGFEVAHFLLCPELVEQSS